MTIKRLQIATIVPNPDQPRKLFEEKAMEELVGSIAAQGLKQPITVRPMDDGRYEIVAGERRWRAHNILVERGEEKFSTMLCHVRSMDDRQRDIEAVIENLARADITPAEEARAFNRLVQAGMPVEELAQQIGVAPHRIRDRLRLLDLAPHFLQMFESGQLSREQAWELSRLSKEADQTRIVQMISRGQLTGYSAIRAAVNAVLEGKTQTDIFGELEPRASESEVKVVASMEGRVDRVAEMVAKGWKDGECVIARKVSPDRARLMADKLRELRKSLLVMERELREAAAQADLVLQQPPLEGVLNEQTVPA